jgi:very-short-patch-repair endonuclease
MGWEPTDQEIEDKLIAWSYTWGDIEEQLENEGRIWHESDDVPQMRRAQAVHLVGQAFRIEAVFNVNGWGDPCSEYHLLFDVTDPDARETARVLERQTHERHAIQDAIRDLGHPWHSDDNLVIRTVPRSTPVQGQICRRRGEQHPPSREPSLDDLPSEQPPQAQVGFERRDVYWLTPIEAKFYDALRETGLSFAVQPWIQGTDRRYRPDFIFFYDGRPHVVELDGHEWHKTKEQRGKDATRERWFAERGLRLHRFTGSQIHADAQACVSELLNLLRESAARP